MSAIPDERLALALHVLPSRARVEVRIALTLREVGGLPTPEIARAFLVPEPTMAQRLVRAKRRRARRRDPVPGAARPPAPGPRARRAPRPLPRLQRGLRRHGGRRARPPRALHRGDPAREAPLRPDARRARGVRAAGAAAAPGLAARRRASAPTASSSSSPTRTASLWDRAEIDEGLRMLGRAEALRRPGPYQLQAAIAAGHAEGREPCRDRGRLRRARSSSTRRPSSGSTAPSPSRSRATSRRRWS